MSGGFFRGTSADQDTRFSNKQAKLLKSQKFAPELDHLVDITKVKMDVVKPWIATRVTEFLGFEDEVLINFIYGLLDGKDINGKEVQIQLTGFMEKNTGKFMKELWGLLLSAQKNASGVPQQFLDGKEDEIRKKKEEADRITLEIQKKKEIELEKAKKMDGEVDITRSQNDGVTPISNHFSPRASSAHKEEDKVSEERNGSRGRNRLSRSPHSAEPGHSSQLGRNKSRSISVSPRRRSSSPDLRYRSPSKRSVSPLHRQSPRRRRSPLRRQSPHSWRRSTPRSWHRSSSIERRRSPSHVRRRSPISVRRRSPSLLRRRSRSPPRHRSRSPPRRRSPSPSRRRSPSPTRRRSPSPMRRDHLSPMRRRSPSPVRRRSPPPLRRRSPTPQRHRSPSPVQRRSRRRSPIPRRRSPSPLRRRSPSPVRRRSPSPRSPRQRRGSPMRSPRRRIRSRSPYRSRSRSPYRSRSPVYRSRRSWSREDLAVQTNGVELRRNRDYYASQSVRSKRSPVRHTPEREETELSDHEHKALDLVSRRPPVSLRSPQREPRNRRDGHERAKVLLRSPEKSQSGSESSPQMAKVVSKDKKRTSMPSEGHVRVTGEQRPRAEMASPLRQSRDNASRHRDSSVTSGDEEIGHTRDRGLKRDSPQKMARRSPAADSNKNIPTRNINHEEYSLKGFAGDQSCDAPGRHMDNFESRKKDRDNKGGKASLTSERPGRSTEHLPHTVEVIEYGPGKIEGEISALDHVTDKQSLGKKSSRLSKFKPSDRGDKIEVLEKPTKRIGHSHRTDTSDSEENEKYRLEGTEKRKHKRSERHQMVSDEDASDDSQIDPRKEAKRRRKEEKRSRKEEKRRRREERHRKREERRADKQKAKLMDTLPSDTEKYQKVVDDDVSLRRESYPSDNEGTETEQKKLEIELRKKALDSLRAKKAINP